MPSRRRVNHAALFAKLDEMLETKAEPKEIVEYIKQSLDPREPRRFDDGNAGQQGVSPCTNFDSFWANYPRRQGANPKKPARIRFEAAVRNGSNPALIIAAAKASYGMDLRENGKFIPMAITWLNQERWDGFEIPKPLPSPTNGSVFVFNGSPEWEAWDRYYRSQGRLSPPVGRYGGWTFPSRYPPDLPCSAPKPADPWQYVAKT